MGKRQLCAHWQSIWNKRSLGKSAERKSAWIKAGFLEAEKILLSEKNTLFESLVNKLMDDPELKNVLYELLFTGKAIPYNLLNKYIETAEMFGFIKNEKLQ